MVIIQNRLFTYLRVQPFFSSNKTTGEGPIRPRGCQITCDGVDANAEQVSDGIVQALNDLMQKVRG